MISLQAYFTLYRACEATVSSPPIYNWRSAGILGQHYHFCLVPVGLLFLDYLVPMRLALRFLCLTLMMGLE